MMAAKQFGKDLSHLERCPYGMDEVNVTRELLPSQTDRDILYELVSREAADLVIIALHGDLSKMAPLADQNLLTLDEEGFFNAHPVIALFRFDVDRELRLEFVEGFYDSDWHNLLAPPLNQLLPDASPARSIDI